MIEPHINEAELRKKIVELFDYRLFPQLLEASHVDEALQSIFIEHLIQLQTNIYFLDAHLEANWQTNPQILNLHWDNIKNSLDPFHIPTDQYTAYLNHIKKYEKHELELRQGKSPLRFDMEYFYFYKSCDVKLLRRLIYERFQLTPVCGMLSDWRFYDLVTEVNDDIEDLFEDLDFINGNRFLISLLYYDKMKSKKIYSDFLDDILAKAKNKYLSCTGLYKEVIYSVTLQRISETKELLDQRIEEIQNEQLQASRLFKYQNILQK
ncbi:MAG: hypothetical protein IPJ51_22565 [Saprospiraceae bacterium]|nr:hypothetical protein [Saprospiraceae bacterium]